MKTRREAKRRAFSMCLSDEPSVTAAYDYREVLSRSLLYYEAQRSGNLPPEQKVTWKKDSALNDREEQGQCLTGGYFDGKVTPILYKQISIPKKQLNNASPKLQFRKNYPDCSKENLLEK
jgi:hypothetical protein